MSDMERATRRMLRQRWAERRRRRFRSRMENIICAVGMIGAVAGLIYTEWPMLVAAFHG